MKKRILFLLLAAMTAFSLCACGKTDSGDADATAAPEAMATETSSDPLLTDAPINTSVNTFSSAPTVTAVADITAAPEATPAPTETPKPTVFHYDLDIPVYADIELLRIIITCRDFCQEDYSSSGAPIMESFLNILPTDAIRTRSDGSKYAIYGTDTGYRFFIIFDRIHPQVDRLYARGFPIVIKEVRSYADFASIKPGDPIGDVIEIDPIPHFFADSYEGKPQYQHALHQDLEYGMPVASIHYLTDGLLKISYDMNEDGEMFVYEILYCEDYKLVGNTGVTVDYKLFDVDLPQP